ncbi:hypothetical protein [uncultured Endozoicomonas sp.]|uniref:hypothetical protein n=1 Tax=uncultured Endozoicomonas sp. TaxID=432652 RepID=UPI00260FFDC5|nr:hypothetical protein [uncultured Endozoicomonas sp.]
MNEQRESLAAPTRNVEIKYKGLLKSINDNGYIYDNGINGNTASLAGFVDEMRFLTSFDSNTDWRINNNLSYPLPTSNNSCDQTASSERSESSGWSIGGSASSEKGASAEGPSSTMGISVSGGFSSDTSISGSTSITCNNDLFEVKNGLQDIYSNYYDELLDKGKKTLYSALKLNRIGDEEETHYQSPQTSYNVGVRSTDDLVNNIIAFQKSLDEENRARTPEHSTYYEAVFPITSHDKHKPFYNNPGKILPEEIRDGIEHNAMLTYFQPYYPESNRYETIRPRIETWYNPGYVAPYLRYYGHTFGLAPIINEEQTKKVVFSLPSIKIDWLDQRLMSVKTLGVESVTGSNKYISRESDGGFAVKDIPYNTTDFAQPFPITEQSHVFYMTNLVQGDPNDKFQGFEINTYHNDSNGILLKQCLGVTDEKQPVLMDCGLTGRSSRTVWRYLTTSYIDITAPAYDRSDFTICLRDKIDGETNECLSVLNGKLEIHDYSDTYFGETNFQWNLVDLASRKINYRNYYNQDPQ